MSDGNQTQFILFRRQIIVSIQEEYMRWSAGVANEPALKRELENIENDALQISDRFYRELEFGTGGLRGKIGVGTNRMNVFTVGKATQGLAAYLRKHFAYPKVCIAYDTRIMSREFAEQAAKVLCANGIVVFLFKDVRPTPMLSYAVRVKNASAGIVITASHNSKEYNGYKVYNNYGGQITDSAAREISEHIKEIDVFSGVKSIPLAEAVASGLLKPIDNAVDASYYDAVTGLVMRGELLREHAAALKIIYTPLHGAGNIPVRLVLAKLGFNQVQVVGEQELPDGTFPTTPYPNPEDISVFRLAVEKARREQPDLILATDPDCDRIGLLAKNNTGDFTPLTGNQIGVLLTDYIIRTHKELGTLPQNPSVIKTIVTSDMAKRICAAENVHMAEVLTGFKYIGEMAEQWEQTREHSFIFGFEESCGYLAGNFVRDKDGVIAAALICEMALFYKTQGLTLHEALEQLFEKYGYYTEKLISVEMNGQNGQEKIAQIMAELRSAYQQEFKHEDLAVVEDYQQSVRTYCEDGRQEPLKLPKSNVLKFVFKDGSWLVLRPSGTEPKIKIYLSAAGAGKRAAAERLDDLEALSSRLLNKHIGER
jgi:phosphoglucomutase